MENDKNYLNNEENLINEDVYKIEFSDQNLDNNIRFQNWKKDMLNLYGNKLILVKCYKDNIIFCAKRKELQTYKFKCPKCNIFICSFCLKYFSTDYKDCCIRGRFKTIPYDGPEYGKDVFKMSIEYLLLIPFISFLYIIGGICNSLFYQLEKPLTFKEQFEFSDTYSDYYKHKSIITYSVLYYIRILFAIIIMFSFLHFVFLDALLTIIILIISIPFKFYPIKYVFGMLIALYNDVF